LHFRISHSLLFWAFSFSALYSVRVKKGRASAEVTRRAHLAAKTPEPIQRTPRIEVFGAGWYCAIIR
jgi:hypothetical protein